MTKEEEALKQPPTTSGKEFQKSSEINFGRVTNPGVWVSRDHGSVGATSAMHRKIRGDGRTQVWR